jgi:hypothetical protein
MDMNDIVTDVDPQETKEWLDAFNSVLEVEGNERAHYLLEKLVDKARRNGAHIPFSANTAYLNTIPPHLEEHMPGDPGMEAKIRALVRWNAVATVIRANKEKSDLGGHIASFASAATLYDVGFNYFFRAANEKFLGDCIYIQGQFGAGNLRACVSRRSHHRRPAESFPSGSRRQGTFVISPSLANARLLAVPHRIDGPRAVDGDLPGAVHALSARP